MADEGSALIAASIDIATPVPDESPNLNRLRSDFLKQPLYAPYVARRLAMAARSVTLLGDSRERMYLEPSLSAVGVSSRWMEWEFGRPVEWEPALSDRLVLLKVASTAEQWEQLRAVRQRFGNAVLSIDELLLPLSTLLMVRERVPYCIERLEELLAYYVGISSFGAPLLHLTAAFPLRGKSVIEFGPLDGCQTAFLVAHGASNVTCVEARPENVMKLLAARHLMGWRNVDIRQDDFHNVDVANAGRFDLAFAHGVYYHSAAPFVFLENLLSLADHVYLGGYCATPDNPPGDFITLDHRGHVFRAKRYAESGIMDFYAGLNLDAYFFHADDLLRFFELNGFGVEVFEDLSFGPEICAGRYLRLLAHRKSSGT